jgi:hypothetical protein
MALMREISELRKSVDILHKKTDAANRRAMTCETLLKSVLGNTNVIVDIARTVKTKKNQQVVNCDSNAVLDSFEDIPEEYQITESMLRDIQQDSRNAGNFAVNLTKKLWPELFGEGNLRWMYNWYGGGKHNKQELDKVRKIVLKKYVCYFYPEFKPEDAWRERIVMRINESLRRNDKRIKKERPILDQMDTSISIPATEPECPDDVFNFTD